MQIGILETGQLPEDLVTNHGTYPDMFENMLAGHGFEFTTYTIVNEEFPGSVEEQSGWIITGSRHGVYEDHSWIPGLESFIRQSHGAEVPMVGICFGHQIMAQALGGRVEWFGGEWGLGTSRYRRDDGAHATLLAMHQDQVVSPPPDATVIMENDFCRIAGLSYQGKAISYQPHPEFSIDLVRDLIESRRNTTIPEHQAGPALASLEHPGDAGRISVEIAEFFKAAARDRAA